MWINQFLARCGVGSRRKVEELILAGNIKINGEIIKQLSTTINPRTDNVELNGEIISLPDKKYYLLNKPKGYTVTSNDKYATKKAIDLLPKIPGLISVGRLDKDSTGLLLFTNDGDFAQKVIHPSQKIEKEYHVSVDKEITNSDLQIITKGVALEDGPSVPKKVVRVGRKKIIIILEEGRNRQIRRMISKIGHHVTELERVRLGKICLDVPLGKYRILSSKEIIGL